MSQQLFYLWQVTENTRNRMRVEQTIPLKSTWRWQTVWCPFCFYGLNRLSCLLSVTQCRFDDSNTWYEFMIRASVLVVPEDTRENLIRQYFHWALCTSCPFLCVNVSTWGKSFMFLSMTAGMRFTSDVKANSLSSAHTLQEESNFWETERRVKVSHHSDTVRKKFTDRVFLENSFRLWLSVLMKHHFVCMQWLHGALWLT